MERTRRSLLPPQRQVQRQWRVQQPPESEVQVKRLGRIVFRIDDQRVGGNLLCSLQAAVNGAAQQELTQSMAQSIRSTCEAAAHSKAGDRVSRQLLAVGIDKSFGIDFGSAERVVAQNKVGPRRIGQHADGTDAAAAVLLCKAGDVLVQRRHPAFEPLPIMGGGVEREILRPS